MPLLRFNLRWPWFTPVRVTSAAEVFSSFDRPEAAKPWRSRSGALPTRSPMERQKQWPLDAMLPEVASPSLPSRSVSAAAIASRTGALCGVR